MQFLILFQGQLTVNKSMKTAFKLLVQNHTHKEVAFRNWFPMQRL